MKAAKITVILVCVLSLISWLRKDYDFGHIARVLPFSSGHQPSFYDAAAIVLLIMIILGLARLRNGPASHDDAEADDTYECEYEADEDDEPEEDDPEDA